MGSMMAAAATWMMQRQPQRRLVITGVGTFLLLVLWLHSSHSSLPLRFGSDTHSKSWPAVVNDIGNSTLGFEEIFVVGLPSRSDRRDGMSVQAAVSDIKLEFRDGVRGSDVVDKAIPQMTEHNRLKDASIGSWRAHMNVVQEIVRRNLTSALIFEDDIDWDVRIKDQLREFALSTHALTQPLASQPDAYADVTYPSPPSDFDGSIIDMDFANLPRTKTPTTSPYGDNWDLLWLGHCGMQFPTHKKSKSKPWGRVVHKGDDTVPLRKYMWSLTEPFKLVKDFPDHTRVTHHGVEGVCSLAYAVSQKGARKLLREVGMRDVSDPFDILLRWYCDGHEKRGRKIQDCISVQPSLFQHHRAAGRKDAASDIGNYGKGFRTQGSTDMIRWSTRVNIDTILKGGTKMWDALPG